MKKKIFHHLYIMEKIYWVQEFKYSGFDVKMNWFHSLLFEKLRFVCTYSFSKVSETNNLEVDKNPFKQLRTRFGILFVLQCAKNILKIIKIYMNTFVIYSLVQSTDFNVYLIILPIEVGFNPFHPLKWNITVVTSSPQPWIYSKCISFSHHCWQ